MNLEQKGRLVVKHLRHDPHSLGFNSLLTGGYLPVDSLLNSIWKYKGVRITRDELNEIVETNNKQRLSYDTTGTLIRANQGHSIPVDLQLTPETPPAVLYHGTDEKYVDSINETGIYKSSRHAVHLSEDVHTAGKVGARHSGNPYVLGVDAEQMYKDGYLFYKSENGVWLTDFVPQGYLLREEHGYEPIRFY